ncbi:MAG: hypothetical protein NVS3B18_12180 [Candidatus Dormibacteria bacterium]
MLYQLTTLTAPSRAPQLLGCYDDRRAALGARDRHVLSRLRAAGGRRIELTHLLLNCPERGPWSTQRLVCSVGQPIGWPVDPLAEVADTARWLAVLRAQVE